MAIIFEGEHVIVVERDGWEFVERKKGKEAVAVIAVTENDELILTEQYRRPVDARVIDWPAGLVGDQNDDVAPTTAKRELEEETGFTCERVEFLASGPTSPGITSELLSFYRARGVRRNGKGEEDITVHLIRRVEAEGWLRKRKGVLIDLKVWGGLHFVIAST